METRREERVQNKKYESEYGEMRVQKCSQLEEESVMRQKRSNRQSSKETDMIAHEHLSIISGLNCGPKRAAKKKSLRLQQKCILHSDNKIGKEEEREYAQGAPHRRLRQLMETRRPDRKRETRDTGWEEFQVRNNQR